VIFATCGSSPMAFDRMMQALEALPASELTVQHGPSPVPPSATGYPFLPFDRMVELMEEADIVVSHAGVGSIMCALRAGHVPIVFPRLKRYSETVDDHQAELATALSKRGRVIVATSGEELVRAVKSVPPRKGRAVFPADSLHQAVRAAIRGEGSRTLRAGALAAS
jgi:UDP-N-acetylglucosamine--N-acetylmuramyl-(pentapeptide) pyrophosphoryl-undecaprenol N-acetylglucosamine transferase